MKQSIILLLFAGLFTKLVFSQSQPEELSVQLWTSLNKANHSITLNWIPDSNYGVYTIFRKTKGAGAWGNKIKNLPNNASQFVDTGIVVGQAYEYFVKRTVGSLGANGYVYSGIEVPAIEYRGRAILLVDSKHAAPLKDELHRQLMDMTGDGWLVQQINVTDSENVDTVKQKIIDFYSLYPNDLKLVYIFGHVPIPYSGHINPGGGGGGLGGGPCDGYYADVYDYDGNWSDFLVNDASASRTENKNVNNDGKFDQSLFPEALELQVGRVDLGKMSAFSETETELLRLYLEKDHGFRQKKFETQMTAVIDDNFGFMSGEAFSANAYRNFPVLIGKGNYSGGDYFGALRAPAKPYIWSYGCGGGWYQGAGGVGTTDSFVYDSTKGIFTMLFGSYFGDWDVNNSFLRAPLAAPMSKVLTNAWVGRPWWQFHHMGLGEHIGYSTLVTQNNNSLYTNAYNFAVNYAHIALMGDPTLRMHIIDPVDSVMTGTSHGGAFVNLNWDGSTDAVLGYNIYRATEAEGKYERINATLVTGTNYTDNRPLKGDNYYMVRAYNLEQTPSGSYYNMSQGTFTGKMHVDSLDYQSVNIVNQGLACVVYPNPSQGMFNLYMENTNGGTMDFKVTDLTGKVLITKKLYGKIVNETVDMSEYPKGIYIIQVKTDEGSITERVIVQ